MGIIMKSIKCIQCFFFLLKIVPRISGDLWAKKVNWMPLILTDLTWPHQLSLMSLFLTPGLVFPCIAVFVNFRFVGKPPPPPLFRPPQDGEDGSEATPLIAVSRSRFSILRFNSSHILVDETLLRRGCSDGNQGCHLKAVLTGLTLILSVKLLRAWTRRTKLIEALAVCWASFPARG